MPDAWDYSQKQPPPRTLSSGMPLLTPFLCGLCVLLTLAYHTAGEDTGSFWYRLGHFGFTPAPEIWNGHFAGLFTSFFVHGSPIHLLFNMIWLARLGAILETTLHPAAYAGFLIAAAGISSGAELAFSGSTGIGASGVVYAMFGLMWAGRGRSEAWRGMATRDNLNLFLVWGVFCIVGTFLNLMNIGNAAHAAGLVFGLAVGWLFFSPRRRPLWAIPLIGLILLTILSVIWLPWSAGWTFWKGNGEFDKKRFPEAIQWYQRSLKLGMAPEYAWENISRAWQNIAYERSQRNDEKGTEFALRQSKAADQKVEAEAAKRLEEDKKEAESAPRKQFSPEDLLKKRAEPSAEAGKPKPDPRTP